MTVAPIQKLSALDAGAAGREDKKAADILAVNINRTILGATKAVREHLTTLFNGGLNQGAGAIAELKDFEEKLKKSEFFEKTLKTAELRQQYRNSFLNALDLRTEFSVSVPSATPGGPATNEDWIYNLQETRQALLSALTHAEDNATQPATTTPEHGQNAPGAHAGEDHAARKYFEGETAPKYMTSWKLWGKDSWTSAARKPKTEETLQPLKRRAALLAGATAGAAVMATFEAGSFLSNIWGVNALGNIGLSTKAALSALPAMNAATSVLGVPLSTSWIPPVAAAVVPTALAVGGLWGAGRIWEGIQRKWLHEDVPERSFTKRVWEGLKLFPYTLPKRIGKWTFDKALENKTSAVIGGLVGFGTFVLTANPAIALGAAIGTTGLRIALNPGGGGTSAAAAPVPH